jgi:hypothetical protein
MALSGAEQTAQGIERVALFLAAAQTFAKCANSLIAIACSPTTGRTGGHARAPNGRDAGKEDGMRRIAFVSELPRRKLLLPAVLALVIGALAVPVAWAGSPHFVDSTVTASRTDNTLTVSGKEAGLGDEAQVHIVVTATAECINGGGNHPKAVNKESVSSEGDFPVQNGKANFSLTLTATFQPPCSPPMTVAFTNVVVIDTTNGVTQRLSGTF